MYLSFIEKWFALVFLAWSGSNVGHLTLYPCQDVVLWLIRLTKSFLTIAPPELIIRRQDGRLWLTWRIVNKLQYCFLLVILVFL